MQLIVMNSFNVSETPSFVERMKIGIYKNYWITSRLCRVVTIIAMTVLFHIKIYIGI